MSLRQITVFSSTKSQPKTFRSEAETWGQLQDALSSEYGDLSKMRAVVRETRTSLELSEAILPEGDFTLFLSAKHIKAGTNSIDIIAVLTSLKEEFSGSIDSIIDEINDGEYNLPEEKYSNSFSKSSPTLSGADLDLLKQMERL